MHQIEPSQQSVELSTQTLLFIRSLQRS